MTVEMALKIREFSINWVSRVVAKRKDYRKRIIDVINDIIPEHIESSDGYGVLSVDNWDEGECGGMNDIIDDYPDNLWNPPTKYLMNDISCAFRIAIDIYIKQSGGVVGYTVGDLKKAFDGNIPEDILEGFEFDINKANDDDGIWL